MKRLNINRFQPNRAEWRCKEGLWLEIHVNYILSDSDHGDRPSTQKRGSGNTGGW